MSKPSKHTPGPWKAWLPADEHTITIYDSACVPMAHVSLGHGMDWVEGKNAYANGVAEANARLIAAAPELLETLQAILRLDDEEVAIDRKYRGEDGNTPVAPEQQDAYVNELGTVLAEQAKWRLKAEAAISKASGRKA